MKAFGITTVIVEAPQDTMSIQAATMKIVLGSVWQGNLLTLDSATIASDLQRQDPVIRTATVARKWFHTVVVTATLKQPSLGWVTGDQTYLLDKTGTVIGNFPSGSDLPVVTDESNLPVSVGQVVAPEEFVNFVSTLVPALAADGYVVKSMSISDTTLDLTVGTSKGYNLIFDTSRTVDSEISDLKAVQALMLTQKATPTKYIDLRITGRAYWE
jgi:cell division septal protein FtsQ